MSDLILHYYSLYKKHVLQNKDQLYKYNESDIYGLVMNHPQSSLPNADLSQIHFLVIHQDSIEFIEFLFTEGDPNTKILIDSFQNIIEADVPPTGKFFSVEFGRLGLMTRKMPL